VAAGQLDDTLVIYLADNGPEGLDLEGALSNAKATEWITTHFSEKIEDIGADKWSPWHGFLDENERPVEGQASSH
jgi:arylsulfatase A-like enzyme